MFFEKVRYTQLYFILLELNCVIFIYIYIYIYLIALIYDIGGPLKL